MITKAFGRALRRSRISAGLSQATVANAAGVTRQFVWMVEKGKRDISLRRAERLAAAVNTSLVRLLSKSEGKEA